ncbi:MAG TPA: hypothetical protein VJ843_03570 [Candidatus Saccharimonadales bacterium]|nr:hypothetical protein [Candidatus Saccharimonadales bacterium]
MSKSKHARGRWDGCIVPAVLLTVALAAGIYVFHSELGTFFVNLVQQLVGR